MTSLDERLQRLEDTQAIHELRAKYSYAADERRWDDLVDLFAEDATVSMSGSATGHPELLSYFRDGIGGRIEYMWHFLHNETVEIAGDSASGNAMLEMHCVVNGEPRVVAAKYVDTFTKVDGDWKFQSRFTSDTTYFNAPYADGWHPQYVTYKPWELHGPAA